MTTLDRKPWPLHGYAPGNYSCRCHTCDKQFVGDKRATTCLECAVIEAKDALSSLPAQAVKPGTLELIEQMIAGTAPMSKWTASVDYSTYDGFEEYLKAQLREKLMLKATLDPNRKDGEKEENLATFVDAGVGALEGALATYRVVRQRVAALAPSQPAAVGERADALWEQLLPLMQVEECPPGDPYKDKVAALALIEAALRSTP